MAWYVTCSCGHDRHRNDRENEGEGAKDWTRTAAGTKIMWGYGNQAGVG